MNSNVRGIVFLLSIITVFSMKALTIEVIAWVSLIPILVILGVARKHLTFLLFVTVPVAVALCIVWGGVLKSSPGQPIGSSMVDGFRYAGIISFRLALLGGITHACFYTLTYGELVAFLRNWRVKGDLLTLIVSSLAVLAEVRLRIDQILVARYVRGLTGLSVFQRAFSLPSTLRPLVANSLRSAKERSDLWERRRLLDRVNHLGVSATSTVSRNVIAGTVCLLWFSITIYVRWGQN